MARLHSVAVGLETDVHLAGLEPVAHAVGVDLFGGPGASHERRSDVGQVALANRLRLVLTAVLRMSDW